MIQWLKILLSLPHIKKTLTGGGSIVGVLLFAVGYLYTEVQRLQNERYEFLVELRLAEQVGGAEGVVARVAQEVVEKEGVVAAPIATPKPPVEREIPPSNALSPNAPLFILDEPPPEPEEMRIYEQRIPMPARKGK